MLLSVRIASFVGGGGGVVVVAIIILPLGVPFHHRLLLLSSSSTCPSWASWLAHWYGLIPAYVFDRSG